jgi:hypothetical protein
VRVTHWIAPPRPPGHMRPRIVTAPACVPSELPRTTPRRQRSAPLQGAVPGAPTELPPDEVRAATRLPSGRRVAHHRRIGCSRRPAGQKNGGLFIRVRLAANTDEGEPVALVQLVQSGPLELGRHGRQHVRCGDDGRGTSALHTESSTSILAATSSPLTSCALCGGAPHPSART